MCSKCKGNHTSIEHYYTHAYEDTGKKILQPNLKKLAGVNIKKIGR